MAPCGGDSTTPGKGGGGASSQFRTAGRQAGRQACSAADKPSDQQPPISGRHSPTALSALTPYACRWPEGPQQEDAEHVQGASWQLLYIERDHQSVLEARQSAPSAPLLPIYLQMATARRSEPLSSADAQALYRSPASNRSLQLSAKVGGVACVGQRLSVAWHVACQLAWPGQPVSSACLPPGLLHCHLRCRTFRPPAGSRALCACTPTPSPPLGSPLHSSPSRIPSLSAPLLPFAGGRLPPPEGAARLQPARQAQLPGWLQLAAAGQQRLDLRTRVGSSLHACMARHA